MIKGLLFLGLIFLSSSYSIEVVEPEIPIEFPQLNFEKFRGNSMLRNVDPSVGFVSLDDWGEAY